MKDYRFRSLKYLQIPQFTCLLTIAVLVLNNHVTIFYPRRIVTDHVRVMPQHGVSIDFTQSQVPETRKQNEILVKKRIFGLVLGPHSVLLKSYS